jgi:SnoaL-like domain
MNDDTDAYVAIERLQRAYADISTRRAWKEVPSLATPDARFIFNTKAGMFEIEGGQAFAEMSIQMADRFSFSVLTPLNSVISVGPNGTARGRCYFLEVAEERQTGEWVEVYGVYYDEYERHEGSWLFSRREYQPYGRRTGGTLEALPLPDRPL